MEQDLIVGVHSIVHAIRNPKRTTVELIACEEGLEKLNKMGGLKKHELDGLNIKLVSSHKVQELAKELYAKEDFQYSRVPSGVLLVSSAKSISETKPLFDAIDAGEEVKILCLDGVTDVHNAGAIMRTAAFYNVSHIVFAVKNNFNIGPSMARIASGALEYIEIVKCNSLPKFLSALIKRGVTPVGLTEHTDDNEIGEIAGIKCLVLGAEDRGLSHASVRLLEKKIRLEPIGKIESLNVSVAAAIAMEKVFS
ncbi:MULTISPECIES: TrmH family RNA methyltransferase [Halobacteriovorax]|uniref:tRNA/rRNA methyltransferase SpoU type domain-containing protein n=1 Tax=Halobacteriovorax vibrionivorans TaxID=2152716 RepID=A0ABY0IJ05_9BACT|nr:MULTISPECIES: TrmH family RNA methyltransferase [Halobacteriovorax]AYF45912.1 RNA methyltransferase, TrmH family [Halobacteriovorax sp. BALOs_7]RZF22949.1 hypothetical protein DAY19_04030 [Halobacteriovorax vibrionivorans]TGD46908.1 hypothetical protein EP118_10410 [Halobacteriovorax sp. Y22]